MQVRDACLRLACCSLGCSLPCRRRYRCCCCCLPLLPSHRVPRSLLLRTAAASAALFALVVLGIFSRLARWTVACMQEPLSAVRVRRPDGMPSPADGEHQSSHRVAVPLKFWGGISYVRFLARSVSVFEKNSNTYSFQNKAFAVAACSSSE